MAMVRVECDRCGLMYDGDHCHSRCPVCGAEVTCSDVTIYLTNQERLGASASANSKGTDWQHLFLRDP